MSGLLIFATVLSLAGMQKERTSRGAPDTVGVERAAAVYTAQHFLSELKKLDTLKEGRIAFDARPADGQVRTDEQNAELARLLGAEVAPRDSVVQCAARCRMTRYAALIRLELRSVNDTVAVVRVTREYPSTFARVPVYFDQIPLVFRKHNGVWTFSRMLRVRSS
jgi:hypothetical protein